MNSKGDKIEEGYISRSAEELRVAPDFFQRWIVREESFAGAEELYKMAEKSTSSLIEFYKKELKKL